MSTSRTPDERYRAKLAEAQALAKAASEKRPSSDKRQKLQHEAVAQPSYMSPGANGVVPATPQPGVSGPKEAEPPTGDASGKAEVTETPPEQSTANISKGAASGASNDSGSCVSTEPDGLIFKLTDDLTIKLMSGTTKQGNINAIRSLLELLGAADWPEEDPPQRALCVHHLTLLRGIATVRWSEADKRFTLDGYTPSALNPSTPWSSSAEVGAEVPAGADADAGDTDGLKADGGATSPAPELQTE